MKLPAANKKLKNIPAKLPDAPMVVVHWFDAGYDTIASVFGEGELPDYNPGCPDVLVGFYLGTKRNCIVIGESAYVREGFSTKYRHIWDIPTSLIMKIELLRPAKR